MREMCKRLEMEPRWLLVSVRMSGQRDFETRTDFNFIRDKIGQGLVDWVAYRSPDRIARQVLPAELLYHHLRRSEIDLYLSEIGRKVDWDEDTIYLQTLGMVSERFVRDFVRRSHAPLHTRYVAEGKGWPGAVKYGFMRDARNYVVVDPEAWRFIEAIHYGYAEAAGAGRPGLRAMRDRLAALGCPMSAEYVRRILKDPIYVTGEWSVTIGGVEHPGRPIPLPRAIPQDVFARNQVLLGLMKGKYEKHPPGTYLLNRIPIYHDRCRGQTGPVKGRPRPIVLRGRTIQAKNPRRYIHYPKSPDCCRLWTLDADLFERAVIKAVRELARDPAVLLAWTARAARSGAESYQDVSPADTGIIEAQLRNLSNQKQRLLREYVNAAAEGDGNVDTSATTSVLEALDHEIEAKTRQLQLLRDLDRARSKAAAEQAGADDLLERLDEILTDEPQDDLDLRARRAAFVTEVISSIVVYDGDDGPEIEIFGPLVPDNIARIPLNPVQIGARHLTGDSLQTDNDWCQSWTVWRVRRPAFQSPRIRLGHEANDRNRRGWTLADCIAAIRRREPDLPPGRFQSTTVRAAWDADAARCESPATATLRKHARDAGMSVDDMVRRALGDEAEVSGRVRRRSAHRASAEVAG
jgi:hypothetical protein